MGRIILVYQPGTPQEEKYCIDCSQVPPQLPPGGPGTLEIHQVERKNHPDPPQPPQYKYLSFQRLQNCNGPYDDDLIMEIEERPETNGRIILAFNGGYIAGNPVTEISIKLLEPNQINP